MNDTYRVFSEPSFFEGIGRLIDCGGTLNEYNNSQSGAEADYKALKSGWGAVGGDIRTAVLEYGQQKQSN